MTWKPYRPADYPIKDPLHNPWMPVDVFGNSAFDLWLQHRPIAEKEFRRLLERMKMQ